MEGEHGSESTLLWRADGGSVRDPPKRYNITGNICQGLL